MCYFLVMGERLKRLRREKGVTQVEVANAIGVTTSAYGHYESGVREPSVDIIILLCKYFDVSADYLLGLTDIY